MATTFLDLLKKYCDNSLSEAEKGTKFEELMRVYLLMRPQFHGMFNKIWLWRDFPFRKDFGTGHDVGVDLVALTVTGEYWAVQCKCYQEDAYISKESVDTFLSTSGSSASSTSSPRRTAASASCSRHTSPCPALSRPSAALPLEKSPSSPLSPSSPYRITKMRFAKKPNPTDENRNGKLDRWEIEDRSRIIYNDNITIRGIPLAAYDYQVNGKSAIEWVMDRYQVTTNKDSGIVNDPNKWLAECGNERYIVDLILKVVTVSMETQKTVNSLPRLEF